MARERITLDHDGGVSSVDATPQMQVSWDHLYSAARMQIPDGAYHLGRGVIAAGQDSNSAWTQMENGERLCADLVIGADGVGSAVRCSMLPDVRGPNYAGYVAWRALVPERLLPATSSTVLSDCFAFYHMPGGQALGHTVSSVDGQLEPGKQRYNGIWYRRSPDLDAILTGQDDRVHRYSLPPSRRQVRQGPRAGGSSP